MLEIMVDYQVELRWSGLKKKTGDRFLECY